MLKSDLNDNDLAILHLKSSLTPHQSHNKFMNEILSNKLDEERRAVTTCHSFISLIVNIQAPEAQL